MDFHADQSNLGHRMSDRFRWLARRHRRHLRGPAVALRYRGLRSSDVLLAGYPRSGTTWLTFVLADGTAIERDVSECHLALPQGDGHSPVILGEHGDEALLGVVTLEILGLVLHPFNRTLQPARMLLA